MKKGLSDFTVSAAKNLGDQSPNPAHVRFFAALTMTGSGRFSMALQRLQGSATKNDQSFVEKRKPLNSIGRR